jgi:hypothetical protein
LYASTPGIAPDNFDKLLAMRALVLNLPPANQVLLRRLLSLLVRLMTDDTSLRPASISMAIGQTRDTLHHDDDDDEKDTVTADGDCQPVEGDASPSSGAATPHGPSSPGGPSSHVAMRQRVQLSMGHELGALDQITAQRLGREFAPLLFQLQRRQLLHQPPGPSTGALSPASALAAAPSASSQSSPGSADAASSAGNDALHLALADRAAADLRAPREMDLPLAVEVVTYLLSNHAELFLMNPYRELVRVSEVEQRAHAETVAFARELQRQQFKTARAFAAMHRERWVCRAQMRAFFAWKIHTLQGRLARTAVAAAEAAHRAAVMESQLQQTSSHAAAAAAASQAMDGAVHESADSGTVTPATGGGNPVEDSMGMNHENSGSLQHHSLLSAALSHAPSLRPHFLAGSTSSAPTAAAQAPPLHMSQLGSNSHTPHATPPRHAATTAPSAHPQHQHHQHHSQLHSRPHPHHNLPLHHSQNHHVQHQHQLQHHSQLQRSSHHSHTQHSQQHQPSPHARMPIASAFAVTSDPALFGIPASAHAAPFASSLSSLSRDLLARH